MRHSIWLAALATAALTISSQASASPSLENRLDTPTFKLCTDKAITE